MKNKCLEQFSLKGPFQLILIGIMLLLNVLKVLSQANPLTSQLGRDSGVFVYVASRILRGGTPYLILWDNKPPGIYFIDAIGLWIGGGTRWGIWWLEFIFLFLAASTCFCVIKNRFGIMPALLSSLVWLYSLNLMLTGGNLTEEYSLLFSFFALYLSDRLLKEAAHTFWIDMIFGFLIGCNFLIRQNNIGIQISVILTLVILAGISKRLLNSLKQLIIIGAGFLIPVIFISLFFLSRDALQFFWEASFFYNLSYTEGQTNLLGAFLSWIQYLSYVTIVPLSGLVVAVTGLRAQLKVRTVDPFYLIICLDFFVEIVLSGLSGRNYGHYFISWLPFVAIASGILFGKMFSSFAQWHRRTLFLVLISSILAFAFMNFNVFLGYWQTFTDLIVDHSKIQQANATAEYVDANTQSRDTVLVWGGQVAINFLADREEPTPYCFYPLFVPSKITDRISLEFYRAISSNPPALILDGSIYDPAHIVPLSTPSLSNWFSSHRVYAPPYLEEFFDFFHRHYSWEATVGGVSIYRYH